MERRLSLQLRKIVNDECHPICFFCWEAPSRDFVPRAMEPANPVCSPPDDVSGKASKRVACAPNPLSERDDQTHREPLRHLSLLPVPRLASSLEPTRASDRACSQKNHWRLDRQVF